jgi:RNA polymerase sigma factor (TIGR02999 family)
VQQQGEITRLLNAWRDGDSKALDRLIPLIYADLRRVAARFMHREHDCGTLQATALLHEAYLRLAKEQDRSWENRSHFLGVAAQIMRNILVDHARAASRLKRGGGLKPIALDAAAPVRFNSPEELLALDQALDRLAKIDPRAGHIVELRYFVGLEHEETAAVLGVSETTVKREWSAARAWLQKELRGTVA